MADLEKIVKNEDTMSEWADKIDLGFDKADANEEAILLLLVSGQSVAGDVEANTVRITDTEAATVANTVSIEDNTANILINSSGIIAVHSETEANAANIALNSLAINEILDVPGLPPGDAVPADLISYYDHGSGTIKQSTIRDMFKNSRLDALVSGTLSSYVTTSTPTALAIFTDDFYSSTPTGITKSSDDTGLTLEVPVRYKVLVTASIAGPNSTDFVFQIYVGGLPCGRAIGVSGDGTGKATNFSIQCITPLLAGGEKLELRVSNNGDTITTLSSDIWAEYAGE